MSPKCFGYIQAHRGRRLSKCFKTGVVCSDSRVASISAAQAQRRNDQVAGRIKKWPGPVYCAMKPPSTGIGRPLHRRRGPSRATLRPADVLSLQLGAGWAEATGKVGEARTVVVAVRRAHELAQGSHLKAILAHQACDRLVIDDHALGVKLTSDAPADSEIAVASSLPDRAAQSPELRRVPEHPGAVTALEGLIRAHLGRSTSAILLLHSNMPIRSPSGVSMGARSSHVSPDVGAPGGRFWRNRISVLTSVPALALKVVLGSRMAPMRSARSAR